MKLTIKNVDGIQEAEKAALRAMEATFPRAWRGVAAFEILEKGAGNKEIDLVLVTDERIIVVELKNWNGVIASDGEQWYLNERRMGRSPVKVTQLKAKILADLMRKKLGDRQTPYVDARVVLCGNVVSIKIPDDEKGFVTTLKQWLAITDPAAYAKEFPNKTFNPPKGLMAKIELFFAGSSFRPREFVYQGFRQDGQAVFAHPDGVYREFRAVSREDANAQALMRRWDFSRLGAAVGTQKERALVALREGRVISYIENHSEELARSLLQPLSASSTDEVTVDHCELFRLPRQHSRLSEFVNRFADKLALEDRLDLIKALLSKFADLHDLQVAHRDIGDHCIWVERPTNVMLSGFLTAFLPQAGTVGGIRELVRAGSARVPDDALDDEKATPFTRDVFLLGVAAHTLLYGVPPQREAGIHVWKPREPEQDPLAGRLDTWFARSLEWSASDRFANAREMLSGLNAIDLGLKRGQAVSLAWFEPFRSATRVQRKYPETEVLADQESSLMYRSETSEAQFVIKAWWGIAPDEKRPEQTLKLLRFLQSAHAIQCSPTSELPRIIEFGYTPQGAFLVSEWVSGRTFGQWISTSPDLQSRLHLSVSLIKALERIHALGMPHGDIHPGNLVVDESEELVFIDIPDLRLDTVSAHNVEYAPANADRLPPDVRDRFAVARLVADALGVDGERLDTGPYQVPRVYSELGRLLESEQGVLSLGPLLVELETAIGSQDEEEVQHLVMLRSLDSARVRPGPLLSDNGYYYVMVGPDKRDPGQVTAFVTGVRAQLRLHISLREKALTRVYAEAIGHQQLLRSINSATGRIKGQISVAIDNRDDAGTLVADLLERFSSQEPVAEGDTEEVAPAVTLTSLAPRAVWRALIDAEEESLQAVIVSAPAYDHPSRSGLLLVPYRTEEGVLDFDDSDDVSVLQESAHGEWVKVGTLVLSETNGSVLAVGARRGYMSTDLGTLYRLRSALQYASYSRRRAAVERVLDERAAIANVLDYLDPASNVAPLTVSPPPTEAELDCYTRRDAEGRIIFELNPDQREAFKTIYSSGPVGLLQGPPGTGKTAFIGTFIHYAVSQGRARNVLLVSQSHEAVNNAMEKTIELSRQSGLSLDAVRIGAKTMLSESIALFHPLAVQQQYRERFRAEFRERIQAVSRTLGLPRGFVEEFVSMETGLGMILRELQHLSSMSPESGDDNARGNVRQKIEAQAETFWAILEGKFGRLRGLDPATSLAELETDLKQRHEVRSPDAVERLRKVARLSSEWLASISTVPLGTADVSGC